MGIWKALTFPFNDALSRQENATDTAEADMEGWGKYGNMSHAMLLWKVREGGGWENLQSHGKLNIKAMTLLPQM